MKPAILLVFDVSRVSCATRQKLLNQMGERFYCYHIGIMKQERPVEVYSLDNLPQATLGELGRICAEARIG
jgi:hypothetical protein